GGEGGLWLCWDHGMVDVQATVDVMGRLRGLPWRRGRDYLAFFDSTMARFWWREPRARDAVLAALAAEPRGRWLAPADLAREGAAFADAPYGGDVFLLAPGRPRGPPCVRGCPGPPVHAHDPR